MIHRPTIEQFVAQLSKSSFFAGVDEALLHQLAANAVWRTYAPGEIVLLEGEVAKGFYYLHKGWLKVVAASPSGREQILSFLEAGDTFYEVGAFTRKPNMATAVALEEASVWLIEREVLMGMVRKRPFLAELLLERMADRLIYLVSLINDLSLRPVSGRLARLLLDSADVDGILHRPRWYTQAELAARLGTVPDVVQRALRELDRDGVIEVQRRKIIILDREMLAEWGE